MTRRIFIQTQGGLGNQLFQLNYAHEVVRSFPNSKVSVIDGGLNHDRDFALQTVTKNCGHLKTSRLGTSVGKKLIRILVGLRRRRPNLLTKLFEFYSPDGGYGNGQNLISEIDESQHQYIFIRGDFISNQNKLSECVIAGINNTCFPIKQNFGLENHIVVHIRRGDYLNHKNYGPLHLKYFEKIMKEFPKDYQVIIHTDDEPYVSQNLRIQQKFIVKGREHSMFELMSDCYGASYFIGSNSTLSWWAAKFLETINSQSLIIMPDKWLRNQNETDYALLESDWSLRDSIWVK